MFESLGHQRQEVFVFGFSYGAQLALELGRSLKGSSKIARMDRKPKICINLKLIAQLITLLAVCEPTIFTFLENIIADSKKSASNVQCIHTNSLGYGTPERDCHQDWNMGNCGQSQPAALDPPMGNHGLCPYFYNSAFDYKFLAKNNTNSCNLLVTANKAKEWPEGFMMGYNVTDFEK